MENFIFSVVSENIETTAKQMTGFFMERNTELKWVKIIFSFNWLYDIHPNKLSK